MNKVFLLIALSAAAALGVRADAAELFLPDVLGAPGSYESYLGQGPDGRVWFTRADASFTSSAVLSCRLERDACVDVRPAFPHASDYDAGATFSADGRTLVFTSRRAGAGEEMNLWSSQFDGASWTMPQPLPSPINSEKAECCAVVAADGSLFFASERDASWDIYVAPRTRDGFGAPVKLPASVNSDGMEWPAWISADASTLLFSSIRKGGIGGDDIYVSCREGGAWNGARNLGPSVNTTAYEDTPRIEAGVLYFASTRPRADGDASANVYRMAAPPLC